MHINLNFTKFANISHFVAHNWPLISSGGALLLASLSARKAVVAWNDAVKLDAEERTFGERLFKPISSRLAPRTEIEVRVLRLRLQRAGIRDDDAIKAYTMRRSIIFISACLAGVALWPMGMPFINWALTFIALAYGSLRGPDMWLDMVISARRDRIGRALPAVVDLMVLCLDVGLSIEAAFDRVTQEMHSLEPLMAEEAQILVNEMGAGLSFPNALKRMADRVALDELTTMSRMISQASALGASVTQALREYSEAWFTKRLLALDEYASKVSAWLVMPVTLCMLPASLLILIAPSIVSVKRAMR